LLYPLQAQVKSNPAEGLEATWARHTPMPTPTQEWIAKISDETGKKLANIAPLGWQSPTVSTIRLPSEVQPESFTAAVAKRGIVVGSGYGKLKSSTFRIGHMGDHTVETLERCLAACSSVLRS
jgi:aspartate aminotransferase-like enzyme